MAIDCILDAHASLGESPVWDAGAQRLYWVDILAPALHCLDPATGRNRTFPMPSAIGCVALTDDHRLLVALGDGLHLFDPHTGTLIFVAHPEGDVAGNRYNDGKVAPDGRFFVGTMDEAGLRRPTGALYRLDPDGAAHRVDAGFVVSNGLAWSADGGTMFHSDSKGRKLWRCAYDISTGAVSGRTLIAEPDEAVGRPDGGATDRAGFYWSAGISAGVLNRWRADGTLDRRIELPCRSPTMPCFGGADMKTIFVTSAGGAHGEAGSLDGGIFAIDSPVAGVAVARFPASRLAARSLPGRPLDSMVAP